MPKNRLPLVYILSNGRSGTTLLDLLLGAHQRMWTVGEVQNLPWEMRYPRAPCGCGNPVQESPFWAPILHDIPTEVEGYHLGYFRNEEQVGRVLRWDLLPDLWRGRVSPAWQDAVNAYADANVRCFEVVRRAAEARTGHPIRWVVDASKDPYRLFWLQQSGRFDIRVVHLVKDPRALVYSMARDWLPWGANRVARYTGRWIVENAIMARLLRTSFDPAHVWPLRYERLAAEPETTLVALGRWLGLGYDPALVHRFREYDNFAISGNMMRWRERDASIRLDERWKEDFPAPYAALVQAATMPFRRVTGYEAATHDTVRPPAPPRPAGAATLA